MRHPQTRLSRLRSCATIRSMMSENSLNAYDLIQPVFVHYGDNLCKEISSMPGQYQFSIDKACDYVKDIYNKGVKSIILFGIPEQKDAIGSDAMSSTGIIQRAVEALKKAVPEMYIITDVCFCEYTDHGHCGVMVARGDKMILEHSLTCENLAVQVKTHADAGADMVAPSGMIDGQVASIRSALDSSGHGGVPIMSYSAKYASSFYGPFRDAAQGSPSFGDRRSHQMDTANVEEALREVELDIEEGADIVMVKPGLAYMDVIAQIKSTFNIPIAVYNVSGEYAMVKAAAANGWLEEEAIVREILLGFKRAGAGLIISYHTADIVEKL